VQHATPHPAGPCTSSRTHLEDSEARAPAQLLRQLAQLVAGEVEDLEGGRWVGRGEADVRNRRAAGPGCPVLWQHGGASARGGARGPRPSSPLWTAKVSPRGWRAARGRRAPAGSAAAAGARGRRPRPPSRVGHRAGSRRRGAGRARAVLPVQCYLLHAGLSGPRKASTAPPSLKPEKPEPRHRQQWTPRAPARARRSLASQACRPRLSWWSASRPPPRSRTATACSDCSRARPLLCRTRWR